MSHGLAHVLPMIPTMAVHWSDLFDAALKAADVVSVRAVLAAHLDREPTAAEMSGASRVAKSYSATSNVQLLRLPPAPGSYRVTLLLARPDADLDADHVHNTAVGRTVKRSARGPGARNVPQRIETAVNTITKTARITGTLHTRDLSPDHASALAEELAEAIWELRDFELRLRLRAGVHDPANE